MRANLWEEDDQRLVDRLSIAEQQELRELDSIPACFSLASILDQKGVHVDPVRVSHVMWGIHREIATLKQ